MTHQGAKMQNMTQLSSFLLPVSPIIVTSAGQVSCRIGASAVLPCKAVGILPITYNWTKGRAETQSPISFNEGKHIDGESKVRLELFFAFNYDQVFHQVLIGSWPDVNAFQPSVIYDLLSCGLYRGWSSAYLQRAVLWCRRILLYCWEPSRTTSETYHPHCHRYVTITSSNDISSLMVVWQIQCKCSYIVLLL